MKILSPEFIDSDKRRILTQLLTASLRQVNYYEAKSGSILGNHYHKETVEYFFLIEGSLIYNNGSVIDGGTLFVVYPMEKHTLTCLTDIKMLTFLTKEYNQENPDVWKK